MAQHSGRTVQKWRPYTIPPFYTHNGADGPLPSALGMDSEAFITVPGSTFQLAAVGCRDKTNLFAILSIVKGFGGKWIIK